MLFHSTNSTPTVHRHPRLGSPQSSPLYATHTTKACAQGGIAVTNTNACSVQAIAHNSDTLVGNILEYEKLVTPLRLHQFEHELSSHPDKTFVAYVLSCIHTK